MKTLFFLLILILVTLGMAPYLDGHLFKDLYMQQVAYYQKELQEKDNLMLRVESYESGWMQSTANLTITNNETNTATKQFHLQPVVIRIKSIIHHGPLIKVNNKWGLGYAYVETSIDLPDILKILVPQNIQGFVTINSRITLDGNTWHNDYRIPATSIAGMVAWGGLSGTAIVKTVNGKPVQINNNGVFGSLKVSSLTASIPALESQTIEIEAQGTLQANDMWGGNSLLKAPSIITTWQDGRLFSVKNLLMKASYGSNNNLYTYSTFLTVEAMQLPVPSPITSLSNGTLSFSLQDIDVNGLRQFREYARQRKEALSKDDYTTMVLKMLAPSSRFSFKTNATTELGAATANVNLSLMTLPKTIDEMNAVVNVDFNLRVARTLFEKILRDNISTSADVQTITDDLIKLGYLQIDNNDYVIVFTKKGTERILNGKTITEAEFNMIMPNVQQALNKTPPTAAPDTTAVAPATTITTIPTPTSPTTTTTTTTTIKPTQNKPKNGDSATHHCYWMQSAPAKNEWVLMPELSIDQCFALDSCNGGLKASSGGCYKWATSPEAKAEPWPQLNPT